MPSITVEWIVTAVRDMCLALRDKEIRTDPKTVFAITCSLKPWKVVKKTTKWKWKIKAFPAIMNCMLLVCQMDIETEHWDQF